MLCVFLISRLKINLYQTSKNFNDVKPENLLRKGFVTNCIMHYKMVHKFPATETFRTFATLTFYILSFWREFSHLLSIYP